MTIDPSEPTVASALRLGQAWEPLLERSGANRRDPLPWLRRFVASTEPMTEHELRVVSLRMSGLTPSEIAHEIGQTRMDRVQVERLCLAVAVRLAVDEGGPGWDLTPKSGTGRRLVQEGLPPYATEVRAGEGVHLAVARR